jgi:signal transduction histidine kinase
MGAQDKERRRIAREPHDELNQKPVLLVSHLEDLEATSHPSKQDVQLATIAEEAREISLGVNRLSHQLHCTRRPWTSWGWCRLSAADSLGIISRRERLRLVGGELRILSSRPAGTWVEVSVPLGNGIPQQATSAV